MIRESINQTNQEREPKQLKISQLINNKNLLKIKIIFNSKNRILLVSPSYTLQKLQIDIKKLFTIKQSQSVFLFVENNKIVDGRTTAKQLYRCYFNKQKYIIITATISQNF